jgi:heme-degrading monooxygenase HmoA
MLQVMSLRSRPNFDRLGPAADHYATLPVSDAFTWEACADQVGPGEWYMVAFRSLRRADADETRLTAYDDWAHAEAMDAPGFVHYFKGPTQEDGHCMSFCLWDSRAEARAASGRPAHREAAALTHESYAEYMLEFHRVVRLETGGFAFEAYDARPPVVVEPETPRAFTPRFAPS